MFLCILCHSFDIVDLAVDAYKKRTTPGCSKVDPGV